MARFGYWTLLLLLPANLLAQTPATPFGLKLGTVPEVLLAHIPELPKRQAVMVEAVEPNSPAWRGGIRRFDVIVSLDDEPQAEPKAAEEKLRQAGAVAVALETPVNNAAAILFYKKKGFFVEKTVPGYYSGHLDALVMTKDLVQAPIV